MNLSRLYPHKTAQTLISRASASIIVILSAAPIFPPAPRRAQQSQAGSQEQVTQWSPRVMKETGDGDPRRRLGAPAETAGEVNGDGGRGSHSFTSQLNLSAVYGTGGARRGV